MFLSNIYLFICSFSFYCRYVVAAAAVVIAGRRSSMASHENVQQWTKILLIETAKESKQARKKESECMKERWMEAVRTQKRKLN